MIACVASPLRGRMSPRIPSAGRTRPATGRRSAEAPRMLTLSLVVQELALGSMAALAAFALRDLPGGFPSLVAHIAAGFWGIAGVCSLRIGGGVAREASIALFLLAAASLVLARLWLRERHLAARVLLVAILVAGSWALLSGGSSLAARIPGN